MMSWILHDNREAKACAQTSEMQLLRNSFFKPPWLSVEKERLDWAPADLEKHPLKLLTSGLQVLLQKGCGASRHSSLPSFTRQKLAMLSHFVHLYAAWRQTNPPLTALKIRAPWLTKSCRGCFALPAKRFHCGQWVCNSAKCVRQVVEVSGVDTEMLHYKNCAKLVGTSIIVYSDDPLLLRVRERANLEIDSFGRPVEFIVAMYAPRLHNKDGTFLLIPIVSQRQLEYLIQRLSILQQPEDLTEKTSLDRWIERSILSLDGEYSVSLQTILQASKTFSLRSEANFSLLLRCYSIIL